MFSIRVFYFITGKWDKADMLLQIACLGPAFWASLFGIMNKLELPVGKFSYPAPWGKKTKILKLSHVNFITG